MFGSQKIPVYCHMGNFGCGDGGWTPAMKIDGTKVRILVQLIALSQQGMKVKFCGLNFRQLFTMILTSGGTEVHSTLQEGRLGSTHKKPSYRPTGTHRSQKSASE